MLIIDAFLFISYHLYCVVVTCPDLSLANGQITYDPLSSSNQYPVDSVASFTCDYGYRLLGSDSTTCHSSGTWSEPTPTCTLGIKISIILISVCEKNDILQSFVQLWVV